MTSLLLIISFLLHIVLMMAVFNLFQQLQTLKQNHQRELDSLLTNFLDEIRHENDMLQKQLSNQKPTVKTNDEKIISKQEEIKKTVQNESENKKENNLQPLHTTISDKIETSLAGQIFQLYNRGESIEKIAKKLNRGKTEVELILKLQRNEKQNT